MSLENEIKALTDQIKMMNENFALLFDYYGLNQQEPNVSPDLDKPVPAKETKKTKQVAKQKVEAIVAKAQQSDAKLTDAAPVTYDDVAAATRSFVAKNKEANTTIVKKLFAKVTHKADPDQLVKKLSDIDPKDYGKFFDLVTEADQ